MKLYVSNWPFFLFFQFKLWKEHCLMFLIFVLFFYDCIFNTALNFCKIYVTCMYVFVLIGVPLHLPFCSPQNKMEECGEMSPALPLSHGPTPSQTALQHTQLMLTGSQIAGVRQTHSQTAELVEGASGSDK